MNKAIVVIGGIATVGVAVGVPAALPKGNSVNEEKWMGLIPTLNSPRDIKTSYQNIECLKDKFQNIQNWNESTSLGTDENLNFNPKDTKGCLVVDYYKQEYENNKWQGKFKLIWSIVGKGNDERGLITVIHAETKKGKLIIDSAFYTLNKQGGNWSVNYGTSGNKEVSDENDLSKWMPQPGTSIKEYKDQYWGFDPKLTNICTEGTCRKKGSINEFSSVWEISDSVSEDTSENIFSNLEEWFKNSFKDGEKFATLISSSLNNPKLTKQNIDS